MALNLIIIYLFVFVGLCATNCYALPTAQHLFTDSLNSRDFAIRYSKSLKQAFPNTNEEVVKPHKSQSFETKCLGDLGCFYNGPPFYNFFLRPVSKLPFDLKDMHTKFYLYTSRSERTLLEPNKESLAKSSYNTSLGLQIFIHGYLMKFTPGILASIEDGIETIMKADRQNIILVDWTATNQEPYAQAVANGRVVGAQVAQLVKFLQNATGLAAKDVYLIGHSLGAHVAGWAGKRIPKLGRISGLDPAGPYFQFGDAEIRLHNDDADFVDIIHTDASDYYVNGMGIMQPIGDIDFYPNGGSNQPGCPKTHIDAENGDVLLGNDKEGLRTDITEAMCNHIRALDYFLESAKKSGCKFIGTKCSDYDDYKQSKCTQPPTQAEMGFFAKKDSSAVNGVKYFLSTSDKSPYCNQEKY